ncbi:MAG: GGDEF domain-containing protein [Solirubrobacterales bacterium]
MSSVNTRASFLANVLQPRDSNELVDELGIPYRVHYWVLAIFAISVTSGLVLFAFMPSARELRNPVTQALCIGGLLIAPMFVILGRRFNYVFREWVFQATLYFAIVGVFISNLMTPHVVAPFMTLYLLGPIGAAYYLPPRKSWPIIATGAAAIVFMSVWIDERDALLRGLTLAIITVASSVMTLRMKRRLIRAVQSNHEIAELDPLTEVANVRKFEERLHEEISRVRRGGDGFALIALDLDNFKQVNDRFNHSVGDDVLVATAEAIQSALQPSDLVVRRGGDEFAVIVALAPGRDIQAVSELACARIARARKALCPGLTPHASAGWVTYQEPETAHDLIERADDALHVAKANAPERRGHGANTPSPLVPGAASPVFDMGALRRRRLQKHELHDDPIAGLMRLTWESAIAVVILCSALLVVMEAAGATSFEFSIPEFAVLSIWILVVIPAGVWAWLNESAPQHLTYALAITTVSMIAVSCLVIGDASPAAVDLFIMAVLVFVTLLTFWRAAIYLVGAMSLYAAFLFSADYPFVEIRVTTTIVNVTLAAIVLAITRAHTIAAAEEKSQLARTDALTALPNLRRLSDRVEYEIRRCTTTGGKFALLILDLDDFKSVNDQYSHSLGDRVLIAVADAIAAAARQADMPARRGGDEFAVVMTDAGETEAMLAASRIERAIEVARLDIVHDINPRASVGWATWRSGENVEDLLARADQALHHAKTESHRQRGLDVAGELPPEHTRIVS